jgi:1-acyl-sn-glycerol-3-phosphate acyltransferase
MVKASAFEGKFWGKFLRKVGCIPVRRGEGDIVATKKILSLLNNEQKVLIFPEGTRNKEGTNVMGPFKPGVAMFAYLGKSPIIPLLYYRNHETFKRNYLMVGKPFSITDPSGKRPDFEEATKIVRQKMEELRIELDEYVASKKRKKK